MSTIPEPATARTTADKPAEPGTPQECKELYGRTCYTVRHLQRAYGVDRLHARGIQGQGQTIAVVMPMKHTTVQPDMNTFSDRMGLPRTKVEVVERGDVREPDPQDPNEAGNVQEANLDLQMAHAMAPRAKLILVSTETNFGDAQDATREWREISNAIAWLARNRDVTAISMSYGIYERALSDAAGKPGDYHLLTPLRRGLKAAAARNISLFAATGNHGPTGPNLKGDDVYKRRTVPWPASDPFVTGVGATDLSLNDAGERTAPDELWTRDAKIGGASGSGTSLIWKDPSVDLTAVGGGSSRTWIYSSLNGLPGQKPGWTRIAGTSAASPAVAGITVLAAQQAGHRLGNITETVRGIRPGTHGTFDLTSGCNSAWDVAGFCATTGTDTASGVGTPTDATRWTRTIATRR